MGGAGHSPHRIPPLLGEKAEPRRRTAFDTRNETCYTPSRKNKSFPFSLPPLSPRLASETTPLSPGTTMNEPEIEESLSRDEREQLQQSLAQDETLLWAGKPLPRLNLLGNAQCLIKGLVILAFCLAFAYKAGLLDFSASGMPASVKGIFSLFLLPFVAIGLGMFLRPWLLRRRRARLTAAVTNRRCLLISPRRLREWPLPYLSVDENPDGSGDIIFPASERGARLFKRREENIFPDIARVRRVQSIIDAASLQSREEISKTVAAAQGTAADSGKTRMIAPVVALVLLVIAVVTGILGTQSLIDLRHVCRHYHATTGTVTGIEWSRSNSRRGTGRVARAHYRFTVDGKTYTGQERTASNVGVKSVGEEIPVLYAPENPDDNLSDSFSDLWLPTVITMVFFLFSSVMSVVILRSVVKNRPKTLPNTKPQSPESPDNNAAAS